MSMKKYVILIFLLLIILQSCSFFNFNKKNVSEIIESKKFFNISVEKNIYIASKRFREPFKVYINNSYAATPSEVIDKIKIFPETEEATIKLYKNYLDFNNFTKSGTYTITFFHSKTSTSLTVRILPEKSEDLVLRIPQKTFFATDVIKIPFQLYYVDKFKNKIIKNIENISIFPYVKNTLKKINNKNYELILYNITKPGKYRFALKIDNKTKDLTFEIIPGPPEKIKFEKNTFEKRILNLATYYDNNIHFPPKMVKITYRLLDRFGNVTKNKEVSYKIVSNNILTPKIQIYDGKININSNVSPGKYIVEFFYNNKKLKGNLEINIFSVPRKIIFIEKKITDSIYLEFSIQDGNTNLAENIEIKKIIIKSNKTEILIGDKLKKYLIKEGNLYILNEYPLNTYGNNIEITIYIKSNIFNYTKKITEKLF
ncbi:hypothetical protein [Marinitoga sp. 1155]|uniref:hypothetical protein n=1 Tax=Marinitoga sp. 1155 TaxID=1428448 RepID=UPI000640EDAE|nr:hypothetical protein [Marinitoga sp. 1155]KLO22613.1 hypothetical protein X274_07880 [Marinitoga sp. 1155]